jgi:hypothetical protein
MKRNLYFIFILVLLFTVKLTRAQSNYEYITFESPNDRIIINQNTDNLWQIGHPGKTFFNAAYAGEKAIVTDTINPYPVNNVSSFIYVIHDPYTKDCYTSMEFWNKYDTDTLNDFGTIEASYDGGNSWVVVSDSTGVGDMYGNFWWEGDFHANGNYFTDHSLNISGKSDGWIKSKFNWQWWIAVDRDTIISNPDSLMIRFTFNSDAIAENKEGWMIDEIVTSSGNDIGGCGKRSEMLPEDEIKIYPNPFSTYAVLQMKDEFKNASVDIYNSFGRKVREINNLSGKEVMIERNNLQPGLYFLNIIQQGKLIGSKRLIILK